MSRPFWTHTDKWTKDGSVFWVDVRVGRAKTWMPLFTYTKLAAARKARDSMKESGLIWSGPGLLSGFDEPITNARVRTVTVKVEVES